MKFKCILPLLILLIVDSSVAANIAIPVNHHNFPFAVATISGSTRCSGSLISRRAVLTINSCLSHPTTEIVMGANDLSMSESTQMRLLTTSDMYRMDSMSVLAIIRFSPQIAFLTDFVNVIQAPFSTPAEQFINSNADVLGFLLNVTSTMPDSLQSWSVRIVANSDCTRAHPNANSQNICTANTSGCSLNIGSPLVVRSGQTFEIVGIQFNRNICSGGNNARNIYLRITPFLNFIRMNM
jgi:secreted trypsin-like serine protease